MYYFRKPALEFAGLNAGCIFSFAFFNFVGSNLTVSLSVDATVIYIRKFTTISIYKNVNL